MKLTDKDLDVEIAQGKEAIKSFERAIAVHSIVLKAFEDAKQRKDDSR